MNKSSWIWGGSKIMKIEKEDPELALKEDLDTHDEFICKSDGQMEFIDFLIFRSIILRQASRKFYVYK